MKPGPKPTHPSGRKEQLSIRLSPHHRNLLDEHCRQLGLNPSQLIARLLEQATPKGRT